MDAKPYKPKNRNRKWLILSILAAIIVLSLRYGGEVKIYFAEREAANKMEGVK